LPTVNINPLATVGKVKSGIRREWRRNPNTGDLRGVYFLEANAGRAKVLYIGKRTSPERFNRFLPEFEIWRKNND